MSEAEQTQNRFDFAYDKLGQRWCHFETEEERQAAIDAFMKDLRAYFDEGYEGAGDGWAPRDWDESHRLTNIIFAVRDLRWKRDADGQGGVEINITPRALGTTYNVFVPRSPEHIAENEWRDGGRKGERPEVDDLDIREWMSTLFRRADMMMAYAQSITTTARSQLDQLNDAERREQKFDRDWEALLGFIKTEAADPLAAQDAYMNLAYGRTIGDERFKTVHDVLLARFDDLLAVDYEILLNDIDTFGDSILKKDGNYIVEAAALAPRILAFQTKYGFIPAARLRNRFNAIGDRWRDLQGRASGLPRSQWHRNGVPSVIRIDQYEAEGGIDMAEPYRNKR